MKDPVKVQAVLESVFSHIQREQMQGIPILNPVIEVQALGFQRYEGRVLGVLITPWLMNVVMLPAEDEDWGDMSLGQKQPHTFPSGTYKFMVNEIEGVGTCQTHSLHSPMGAFTSQKHAVAVAQEFIDALMVERIPTDADRVDEELLGKVLRGEVVPDTNFEDFAALKADEISAEEGGRAGKDEAPATLSRRSLLKGKIRRTA